LKDKIIKRNLYARHHHNYLLYQANKNFKGQIKNEITIYKSNLYYQIFKK